MKKIILIPVLNEKNNITRILKKIRKYYYSDIVYINDNSTDGTTEEIDLLSKKYKNIFHINRKNKSGIGSAHKDGIKWCYRKNYDLIITMDGDGTHDPKYINKLIRKNIGSDITITNRFLNKNSLRTWSLIRIIITNIRHFLISSLLGIKHDSSGAFRCINTKRVKLSDLLITKEDDYAYFWKSIYFLHKKKYKISEISISLPRRGIGYSKMTLKHILHSFFELIRLYISEKILNKR